MQNGISRRRALAALAGAAGIARGAQADWAKIAAEALGYLRGYLRIDTSNPPGNVAPAVAYVAAILEKNGIPSERLEAAPGKVSLLARLRGSGAKRPLLLLSHTDTVPADRSRWPQNPFGGEIRLNRLWGRGAVDMKSTGIVHLMTLLLLKRNRAALAREVILAATADEEVGGQAGVGYLLEKHPAKVEAEYVLDEGGFSANRLFTEDGVVHGVSVAQKQVLWLRLTMEGTAGHGSQPTPDNAVAALARALARVSAAEAPAAADPVRRLMENRLGALAQNRFANAIQRNTVSLTTLRAGVGEPPKENVIPSLAAASLDCRLLPSQSSEEFIAWVRQVAAEPRLKVEVTHHAPAAPPSSTATELFRRIESTLAQHAPRDRVTPYLTPFGTDGNQFRRPDRHVYGFFPVVISAEEAMSMHSDAERIPVEPLQKGLQIFYEVVEGICA